MTFPSPAPAPGVGLFLPDGQFQFSGRGITIAERWDAMERGEMPRITPEAWGMARSRATARLVGNTSSVPIIGVDPAAGASNGAATLRETMQAAISDQRIKLDEIYRRWANRGDLRYDASQALADISAGTASVLPAGEVAELRRTGAAPRATAALGQLLLDGAVAGHETLARYPEVEHNAVQLLRGNSEFLPRLFEDVRNAQHHINIIQFNWESDGGGRELADLLKLRKQLNPDLEINVYADAYGIAQGGIRRHIEFFNDLEDAGINVKRNWRFGTGKYMHAWEHRKLYEIDSTISYLGGLGLGKKYDTWTDLMVRMEGPVSAQSATQFIGSWANRGGEIGDDQFQRLRAAIQNWGSTQINYLPGNAPAEDAVHSVQLLMNRPRVDMAASEQFLRDAAAAGEGDRLWITTPYIGGEEIAAPLREAAARGADVRVLVPGLESGRNIRLLKVSRTFYKDLMDAGVEVRELPSMLHAKSWIFNDVANVGSMNLSMNSFQSATEIVARVKGKPFLGQLERFFVETEGAARPVPMAELTTTGMTWLTRARKFLRISF